jgi:hypothetical protein
MPILLLSAVVDVKIRAFPNERPECLPRLFFSGREVSDTVTCEQAGLKNGSVAHAMMRPAGAARGAGMDTP